MIEKSLDEAGGLRSLSEGVLGKSGVAEGCARSEGNEIASIAAIDKVFSQPNTECAESGAGVILFGEGD